MESKDYKCPICAFKPCQQCECVMYDDRKGCLVRNFLYKNVNLSERLHALERIANK